MLGHLRSQGTTKLQTFTCWSLSALIGGLFGLSLGVSSTESARCSSLSGCLVSSGRQASPQMRYFGRFCHTDQWTFGVPLSSRQRKLISFWLVTHKFTKFFTGYGNHVKTIEILVLACVERPTKYQRTSPDFRKLQRSTPVAFFHGDCGYLVLVNLDNNKWCYFHEHSGFGAALQDNF